MAMKGLSLVGASASAHDQDRAAAGSGSFLTRWRLGLLNLEIARLEDLMTDEFATPALTPLLREHQALSRRRDALQARTGLAA